eukprot:3197802-Prymnesium_polylepis.1
MSLALIGRDALIGREAAGSDARSARAAAWFRGVGGAELACLGSRRSCVAPLYMRCFGSAAETRSHER